MAVLGVPSLKTRQFQIIRNVSNCTLHKCKEFSLHLKTNFQEFTYSCLKKPTTIHYNSPSRFSAPLLSVSVTVSKIEIYQIGEK